MAATFAPFVVVVPQRALPSRQREMVYVRRRVLVSLVLLAVVVAIWLGVGSVLANRGGDPASASTARPALHSAAAAVAVHVVQPGDTLWSLAQRYHGQTLVDDYLDQLIALNGGTAVSVGQAITLP